MRATLDGVETHGPARITVVVGLWRRVEECMLEDGSRAEVKASLLELVTRGTQPSSWRLRRVGGDYAYGRLEVTPGVDVLFVEDDTRRPAQVDRGEPFVERFVADLRTDARLMELLQSDEFAELLYAAMCNVTWRHCSGEDEWSCSFRAAGALVAELRGKSEEYVDFYLSGGEGTIAAEVATELARIGWVPDPS